MIDEPLYFIENNDLYVQKIKTYKYSSCSVYKDIVVFGSVGSIHVYRLNVAESPTIISVNSSINGSVTNISISSDGNILACVIKNHIFFVESLNNTLVYKQKSVKIKDGSNVTSFKWTNDLHNNRILIISDDSGSIWGVTSQYTIDEIKNVGFSINHIEIIHNNIVYSTDNGIYILDDNGNITTKLENKDDDLKFTSLFYFAEGDAIIASRRKSELAVAQLNGQAFIRINPLSANSKNNVSYEIPETLTCDMGKIVQIHSYLISIQQKAPVFILSKRLYVEGLITEESDLIGYSVYDSKLYLIWKNRFSICSFFSSTEEMTSFLIEKNNKDLNINPESEHSINGASNINSNPEGGSSELLSSIVNAKHEKQYESLRSHNIDLYNSIIESDIPSDEMMDDLEKDLELLEVEAEVTEKISQYVLKNPCTWEKWKRYCNNNMLVEVLNKDPQYSKLVVEIAKYGISQLCEWLRDIAKVDCEVLAANSPPIYIYNIDEERTSLYNDVLLASDPFYSEEKFNIIDQHMIKSYYEYEKSKLSEDELNVDSVHRLLEIYNWEKELVECVKKLAEEWHTYHTDSISCPKVPEWITNTIKNPDNSSFQKTYLASENKLLSLRGRWGVHMDIDACCICGLDLTQKETLSAVIAFPCKHCYHNECLKTRNCPLCSSIF